MEDELRRAPRPPEHWEPAEPYQESFVAKYDELTEDQQRALHDALTWLWAMATRQSPPRAESGRMERSRYGNTFLIDGARGAGKTLVLVKLVEVAGGFSPLERGERGDPRPDDRTLHAFYEKLTGEVSLVPLRILDLKPFPNRTLILDLASALLELLRQLEDGEERAARDPVPEGLSLREHPARKAWKRFARAAALGFARTPSAKLDPSDYVAELEQASEQRQEVERTFQDLVDELVRGCERRRGDPPALLVLPIDDADMHPDRTVELLDLLRLLRHPRLVYVATGDSQLFLDVLEADFAARVPGDETSRVRPAELAGQALDKVFPRPQRARLEPLSRSERVAVLHRVSEVGTPHELLFERLRRYDHFLAQGLPERIRELGQEASVLRGLTGEDAVVEFVVHLWRAALDATDLPSETIRELYDAVKLESAERARRRMAHVQSERAAEMAPIRGSKVVRLEPVDLRPVWDARLSRSITADLRVSWSLRLGVFWGDDPLPERVAAAYALATAFALSESSHRGLANAPSMPFVTSSVAGKPVTWPVPQWEGLDGLLGFAERWERNVEEVQHGDAEALFRTFVWTVLGQPGALPSRSFTAALAGALRAVDHQSLVARWIEEDLPLLAAPEYGLPPEAANGALDLWSTTSVSSPEYGAPKAAIEQRRRRYEAAGIDGKTIVSFDRRLDYRWSRDFGTSFSAMLARYGIANTSLSDLAAASELRSAELRWLEDHPEATAPLRAIMRSLPTPDANSALVVLQPMWREVGGAPDDVRRAGPGRLEVTPRARLVEKTTSPPERVAMQGGSVELRLAPDVAIPSTDDERARSLVYRLCWDTGALLRADPLLPLERTDRFVASGDGTFAPWRAITIRTAAAAYHWPTPGYPLLYLWERLAEAWDEMLRSSRGITVLDEATAAEWVMGLAVSWVCWMPHDGATPDQAPGRLRSELLPTEDLATTMAFALEAHWSDAERRWPALGRGWAEIAYVVFSTPSISGMTNEFADLLKKQVRKRVDEHRLAAAEDRRPEIKRLLRARDEA